MRAGKDLLRFLTCGSVDDGKSTLIGRLLYDTKLIFDDQLVGARARIRRSYGTTGDDIDFALLVDGLEAEREQGITIDVAYRFFATAERSFIVADTPGHEQYTRNMATGASNADLAVILVDARKGVLTQTQRHALHLLAARHPARRARGQQDRPRRFRRDALRPNRRRLSRLRRSSSASPRSCRSRSRRASATTSPSRRERTPWYRGPTLLEHLETRRRRARRRSQSRSAFRCNGSTGRISISAASAGTVASGQIAAGDAVVVAGLRQAVAGQADRHLRRRHREGARPATP